LDHAPSGRLLYLSAGRCEAEREPGNQTRSGPGARQAGCFPFRRLAPALPAILFAISSSRSRSLGLTRPRSRRN